MPTLQNRWADRNVTAPAGSAEAITPNDNADLTTTTRGLYIGGAGNLRVVLDRDTTPVTFVGVVAGSLLPIRATRVYATSTTATNIVALY